MSDSALICRTDERRRVVRKANESAANWNGIEFVEFEPKIDAQALRVYFLCEMPPGLWAEQLHLYCPILRKEVKVAEVTRQEGSALVTTKDPLCKGAAYCLTIVGRKDIDPRFARYEFTAHGETVEVDPKPRAQTVACTQTDPAINYLARDYAGFRQLLLDRLALTTPGWTERHIPDLGMTLVELFAYVGDYLAYFQDAVATEAYLDTARQRQSVQRHVRLVDYQLHEGCNARTFLHCEVVGSQVVLDPAEVYFVTEHPDHELKQQTVLDPDDLKNLPPSAVQPFEIVRGQPRCRRLECDDIKNIVGLMGVLQNSGCRYHCVLRDVTQKALAKFLWDHLPSVLQGRLRNYLSVAKAPPDSNLTKQFVDSLNGLAQQYCLKHAIGERDADEEGRNRLAERLNDSTRVQENIAVLRKVFGAFFAKSDDKSIELHEGHNTLRFYTWSRSECYLPIGTTHATLCDDAECDAYADPPPPLLPPTVPRDFADVPNIGADSEDDILSHSDVKPPPLSRYVLAHMENWNLKHLSRGDILIFEEQLGPRTHNPGDADPTHRQAVRLTRVNFSIDPVAKVRVVEIDWDQADALTFPLCISSIGPVEDGCPLRSDISVARGNILLIDHGVRLPPEWLGEPRPHVEPPVCGASYLDERTPTPPTRTELFRPKLKEAGLTYAAPIKNCQPAKTLLLQKPHEALPALQVSGFPTADEPVDSFRDDGAAPPTLAYFDEVEQPLALLPQLRQFSDAEIRRLESMLPSHAARVLQQFLQTTPAGVALQAEVERELRSPTEISRPGVCSPMPTAPGNAVAPSANAQELKRFVAAFREAVRWNPKQHLLDSDSEAQDFVIEVDNERRTQLRFGDDDLARRPLAGTSFYAEYRVGGGTVGNVGAEKIKHITFRRTSPSGIVRVRNPLPAVGGTEPESLDHARMHAPHQFKKARRAITAEDYAEIARREFPHEIQQARAMLQWMGMAYEVSVAIDPVATVSDPDGLVKRVERKLETFRRIGHLLRVNLPIYVGVEIAMTVCVENSYLSAHVRQELLDLFSNRVLPDNSRGFFHPDNFGFGDELYLSKLIRAAKTVRGVENVEITCFQKIGQGDQKEKENGVMFFGPLEIPRLDNDPFRRENGVFCLNMRGAR